MAGLLVKTGKSKAVIIPKKDVIRWLKIIGKEDKALADKLRLVINAYQINSLALYKERIRRYKTNNKALS